MTNHPDITEGAAGRGAAADLSEPESEEWESDEFDSDEEDAEPDLPYSPPSPPVPPTPAEEERSDRKARHVYLWLMLCPVLTVPWMAANLSNVDRVASSYLRPLTPLSDYHWAVATPALVHVVLLLGLMSPSLFARRHVQQGLLLVLLRTLTAVLVVGVTRGTGWPLWLLVNGALWWFGSRWGLQQTSSGDCWLMRVRGEGSQLPRPWAVARPAPDAALVLAPSAPASSVPVLSVAAPLAVPPVDALAAFERGLALSRQGRRDDAVTLLMRAFRHGDADLRRQALAELDKLGEVERG